MINHVSECHSLSQRSQVAYVPRAASFIVTGISTYVGQGCSVACD
jgi:hypothetical protein